MGQLERFLQPGSDAGYEIRQETIAGAFGCDGLAPKPVISDDIDDLVGYIRSLKPQK